MLFFAYILKSEYDGTHYYGSSKDLDKRLDDHNKGRVRYTKGRRPWKLIYKEAFNIRSDAVKRELFFKSVDGYKELKNKGII